MSEAAVVSNNEATTTVQTIIDKQREPGRVEVVTNDNFEAFVDKKLGIVKEDKPADPEEAAKKELEKVESEKKARKGQETDVEAEAGVAEHLPKDKKGKLNERFSELTNARKQAEERAEKAAAEARAARDAKEAAERLAAELKAKYEPVKTDPDPEPLPSQFTDINEYSKAVKEWAADNALREAAKKAEQDRRAKEQETAVNSFKERQEAAKKEIPDYEETIKNSAVKVSNEVRDAIIESEQGPRILHHLAKNPDVADKLAQMTVGRALKEIGRLEATLGGTKADGAPQKEVKTPVAEISKAPAPITPLRGANAPVVSLSGTDAVPASMTYEDWKALRRAGKIK
ncbi:MAG TPA: hypothetical protein VF516_03255 [Kofleriaceae bacterium]